jgi:molybdopterin/thiamine biosynthesis adenylyltransferase
MKAPFSVTIDETLFKYLHEHLFPGDNDEHGAVLIAGISETDRGTRFLVREVIPAVAGRDYVPGTRGYRALTARFVAELANRCDNERLCYMPVHCHPGHGPVQFSSDDLASHERGYPAILEITQDGPVVPLVFSKDAVAGIVWTPQGRFPIESMTIVSAQMRRMYPNAAKPSGAVGSFTDYDRQTRLFGDTGQAILSALKVGIIGLGGGGSLINEWIARLGVGHIVGIDFDRVDLTNLTRIVGATRWDARTILTKRKSRLLVDLGKRWSSYKVNVARRVARTANPAVRFEAIIGSVLDEATAKRLSDVDFLFLASDSIQSRLVFNALVQQYLIPGIQIGAKVSANRKTGEITDIFTASRPVLPGLGNGCLECNNLIPPDRLQRESLTPDERRAQDYVDDAEVHEPSVITLNVLSAGQAVNDFMMMFTGLFDSDVSLQHHMNFVRERKLRHVDAAQKRSCPDCSTHIKSRFARGDRTRLPCRST